VYNRYPVTLPVCGAVHEMLPLMPTDGMSPGPVGGGGVVVPSTIPVVAFFTQAGVAEQFTTSPVAVMSDHFAQYFF